MTACVSRAIIDEITSSLTAVYRIDEYIPDVLYDHWETVRDFAIDWMIRVGFLGRGSKGAAKGPDGPRTLLIHCLSLLARERFRSSQ